ncbi:MAG TPA: hypothetical protein V6C81_04850 [Planktothrix sp.]
MSDSDLFTFTWTRRQLYQVKQALSKRKQFLKQGQQRGSVDEQDVHLVEALLQDIAGRLSQQEIE